MKGGPNSLAVLSELPISVHWDYSKSQVIRSRQRWQRYHFLVVEHSVKTHSSRVFDKLGASRRTQAAQLGKEFGLLP
jgi:hypothetical protein